MATLPSTLVLYLWAVFFWVVEPALFEWNVFEKVAPIWSPPKSEVRSVIRFLNAKGKRPAEIHEKIVAVYGNPAISTCFYT
jgi:hypothetical protein